jgi:hypothetical protein
LDIWARTPILKTVFQIASNVGYIPRRNYIAKGLFELGNYFCPPAFDYRATHGHPARFFGEEGAKRGAGGVYAPRLARDVANRHAFDSRKVLGNPFGGGQHLAPVLVPVIAESPGCGGPLGDVAFKLPISAHRFHDAHLYAVGPTNHGDTAQHEWRACVQGLFNQAGIRRARGDRQKLHYLGLARPQHHGFTLLVFLQPLMGRAAEVQRRGFVPRAAQHIAKVVLGRACLEQGHPRDGRVAQNAVLHRATDTRVFSWHRTSQA